MTEEMKKSILQDYNNRNIPMRQLESKYHIARSKIAQIAVELGAEPRRPKIYGKKRGKQYVTAICPNCKRRIDIQGALLLLLRNRHKIGRTNIM